MNHRILEIKFRWPVKQVDEKMVEVLVPMSKDGLSILNKEFCLEQKLSGEEIDKAEYGVLKSIAVIE